MWTSFCNFLHNKLLHRPELEFRRSDESCGFYGKRLKLIDRIWSSNGFLKRSESSRPLSMQKENFDISDDDEDCFIIAEFPRRKKPINSESRSLQVSPSGENFNLPRFWSSFAFKKDPVVKDTQDSGNNVKFISKLSVKEDNTKVQPKKFFSTQRTLSQGKLARSKLSSKNHLKKKLNFLQESYRLTEKLQYIQLLKSHVGQLWSVGNPRKSIKASEEHIEVIDLADEEPNEINKKKETAEEQDVQFVKEVHKVRSFQDVLKCRPLNVDIALKSIPSDYLKKNSDNLNLPENTVTLVEDDDDDDDDDDDSQKTDSLEEKLRNFMQITSPSVYEVESRDQLCLPELTIQQEKKIKNAFVLEPRHEILSSAFGLQITRQDMQTLAHLNWLNDEIINFYMNLIMERNNRSNVLPRVYVFNSFFYPKLVSGGHSCLKRWTKQVDIFSFDLILVPVHLGMHWCLSVIDFRHKTIKYYDSIGSPNHQCLERLLLYLKAESLDKRKQIFSTFDWEKSNVEDIPQQMNGGDCGVFSCMFAEFLARDCKILFTQDDMPYFRKKMVVEILERKLLT